MSPPAILASMRPDGSRLMLQPAEVKGKWMTRRRVAFAVLMAFYVFAPLVTVGGHPMVQLDVSARKFYLFGQTFNAQDFWMVVLFGLTFAFGLLLITAWRGRIWCGWACPQTVFLEGVYRPIERFFDGPRERRLKLQQAPWTASKIARRVGKNLAFLFVSVNIAHATAAIFVGPKELLLMIIEGPASHMTAFILTAGFTAILTFNFAWFREQFCVVLCPYGRLQSLLHDKDSVTVFYDEQRGEPRGHLAKNAEGAPKLGDCIDCHKCVTACPTGIDIRDGLQMECLACLQCVDACDGVMKKVGRAPNLIGLFSENRQKDRATRVARPRLFVYGAMTLLTATALTVSLLGRTPFESNIIRPRGANPFVVDGDVVRNAFEVHLVNKHPEEGGFAVKVTAPVPAEIAVGTPTVSIPSLGDTRVPVSASIAKKDLGRPVELTVELRDVRDGTVKRKEVRFLAPPGLGH